MFQKQNLLMLLSLREKNLYKRATNKDKQTHGSRYSNFWHSKLHPNDEKSLIVKVLNKFQNNDSGVDFSVPHTYSKLL